MEKDELISLVETILAGKGGDEYLSSLMKKLRKNIVDPDLESYMFFSEPPLSAEEIVDKALAYRPIILPGPDG